MTIKSALDILWRWYNELEWKYNVEGKRHLVLIRQKLKEDLMGQISKLTENVCIILESFPLSVKSNNQRTVIVDYNLPAKISKHGLAVERMPLNRISFLTALTRRCKYLIIWLWEEQHNVKEHKKGEREERKGGDREEKKHR